jgi:hypothetical protein
MDVRARMTRRGLALATATLIAVGVCWVSGVLAAGAHAQGDINQASCPASTELASGFGSFLPDCRAYEVVSEANSDDVLNIQETYGFPEGQHFVYSSPLPAPGEAAGAGTKESYLATRTAGGWQQRPLSVPQGEGATELSLGAQTSAYGVTFTGGFSDALVMKPFQDALEAPRLDEATGAMVYELSLASDKVATVSLPDSGNVTQGMLEFPFVYKQDGQGHTNGWGLYLDGASRDGSKVFFSTTAKLPTAPGTPEDTHAASAEVYERTGGHTYLVGVLPNGEVPVCGAEVGQNDDSTARGDENYYAYGAISSDGANVVFHAPGENAAGAACTEREKGLFLRETADGTTVSLPGTFYAGRAGTGPGEEEKIFTVEHEVAKIYEYHVTTKQIVEVASGSDGLLAYSANGSRVYYLGPEEGVYLYEEGAPEAKLVPETQQGRYLATTVELKKNPVIFTGAVIRPNEPTSSERATNNAPVVTPNGNDLMFLSPDELTGYKNCVEVNGEEQCHVEVYLYDAGTNEVTCLSCAPTNAAPQGDANLVESDFGPGAGADFVPPSQPLVDSRPAEGGREAVMRAVFETTEGLVPQDSNGTMDVYEWEREETEGCSRRSLNVANLEESPTYSHVNNGCLYLLTSGTGEEVSGSDVTGGSHLVGASEDLKDIYMQTGDALVPGVDNTAHVYDVRVDGGFPRTSTTEGCEPGVCRPEGETPSVFGEPGSVGFTGAGNLKPATVNPKSPSLTRKQKLARALEVCRRRKSKRKRAVCEGQALRRYRASASRKRRNGRKGGSK